MIEEFQVEVVDIAFSELKEFISIMYSTCIRFYNLLLDKDDLDELREDLIERITTMLFYNQGLTNLILHFCKLLTKKQQTEFESRLIESTNMDLKPSDLNVSKYFNLDHNSNILTEFLNQIKREKEEHQRAADIDKKEHEDAQFQFS